MATPLDLIQMGGPTMLILLQLFLFFIPLVMLFTLFSFLGKPRRKRLRAFARIALGIGILFVLIGALGFSNGATKLKSALATEDFEDPARIQAIGMKEARIPLWTGMLFGTVAAVTSGLYALRGSRLREPDSAAT